MLSSNIWLQYLPNRSRNNGVLFVFSMDDRKQFVAGCKFTWNVHSNQYRITDILKIKEVKPDPIRLDKCHMGSPAEPWNPTKLIAPQMRQKIQQPYARRIRYLSNELTLSGLVFFFLSLNNAISFIQLNVLLSIALL